MVWSWSIRIGVNCCGLRFLAVFQDILQRCICHRVKADSLFAGHLHPGITIGSCEVQDPHAGLVRLLFKICFLKQGFDKGSGDWSDCISFRAVIRPVKGTECHNCLMVWRHVISDGNIPFSGKTSLMDSDPVAFLRKDLDFLCEHMHHCRLFVILVRYRIIKTAIFYVKWKARQNVKL